MRGLGKIFSTALLAVFTIGEVPCANAFESAGGHKALTVIFTSDLHSNINSCSSIAGAGGYARISALVNSERKLAQDRGDAVIVVDAGDFSMGSVYNILFSEKAPDLVALGMMGYDAFIFGNHDFDYGPKALSSMLCSAKSQLENLSGNRRLPVLVNSNLKFDNNELNEVLEFIGACSYAILPRNGLKIGVMGVMGSDGYSTIALPEYIRANSNRKLADSIACVLKEKGADFVVELAHSGLYEKTKGVDAVIGGHDHIPLLKAGKAGTAVAGNAGCYGEYVGVMRLAKENSNENAQLLDYRLIPVTQSIASDSSIVGWTNCMRLAVRDKFESLYGIDVFDTAGVLLHSFPAVRNGIDNYPLGNLVADAFRCAALANVANLSADSLVALVPFGSIRKELPGGAVTYADIYESLSLGTDEAGRPGFPLVLGYVYGKELEDIAELTPSLGNMLPDARLSFSGLWYSYNSRRIPLTRVREVFVGSKKVNRKKLYPVVTNLYTAQLMGLMRESSFGILDVAIKRGDGSSVANLDELVISDSLGNNVVEWTAMADYMSEMTKEKEDSALKSYAVNHKSVFVWLYYLFISVAFFSLVYLLKRLFKR